MRISDWSSDVCSSDLGKLLGDRSQRRAGRDADEQALLPRRAAGIFLRVVRIDLDHPVQHPRMEVGGHEARAYPLARVRAGRAPGTDRLKRGFARVDLEAGPFLLQQPGTPRGMPPP